MRAGAHRIDHQRLTTDGLAVVNAHSRPAQNPSLNLARTPWSLIQQVTLNLFSCAIPNLNPKPQSRPSPVGQTSRTRVISHVSNAEIHGLAVIGQSDLVKLRCGEQAGRSAKKSRVAKQRRPLTLNGELSAKPAPSCSKKAQRLWSLIDSPTEAVYAFTRGVLQTREASLVRHGLLRVAVVRRRERVAPVSTDRCKP